MGETPEKITPEEAPRFTVEVEKPQSTSFEAGGEAVTRDTESTTWSADEEPAPEEPGDDAGAPGEEGEKPAPEDGTPEEPAAGDDTAPEDLGEYKADDPDIKAKFDKRYYKEDGTLDTAALSTEFWANTAKAGDGVGSLNEATYAYLQDVIGIDKASAQKIEKGLVAERQREAAEFHAKVGGADKLEAAISWAVEGGYTQEQRDRYRALQAKGGADFEEAAELLVARFLRAKGGKRDEPGQRRPGDRRPSSPQRKPEGGRSEAPRGDRRERDQQGDAFKNLGAYSEAFKDATRKEAEARKTGDMSKIREAEAHRKAVYQRGRKPFTERR